MTSTNRFANRLLLLLVGLVVFLSGLSAVSLALIPAAAEAWNRNASAILNRTVTFRQAAAGTSTVAPWQSAALLVLLVLLIVLIIVFISQHRSGRTRRLLVRRTADDGETTVDAAVAIELFRDALAGNPAILAAHVTAHRMTRATALKITVICRRGASPKEVGDTVEGLLVAFDRLLGAEVPALVQLVGGFRARLISSTRLDGAATPPQRLSPL